MRKLGVIFITAMAIAVSVTGCGKGNEGTAQSTEVIAATQEVSAESEAPAETVVKETETEQNPVNEYYVTKKIKSQELAGNLIDAPTENRVSLYLPPSYYDSEKTYPVVYYLHGFGESSGAFVSEHKTNLKDAFEKGAEEFILVGVEGGNRFFTDSPVSGNWESYIVKEVIPYIDENFRTINDKNSRGICGFSMGGYGAYSLALNHPDVFSAFLAMSPGLIADNDLPSALETWKYDEGFKKAYAQAFSPNIEDTEQYGNIPELSGTAEDDKIVEDWMNGFGNIGNRLDTYLALNEPLTAMGILYGETDSYDWIPRGCEFLSAELEKRGIEHMSEGFDGVHMIHPQVIENYLVPFFNENLTY